MKVENAFRPANDMTAMVVVPVPAGPCTPGFTQVLTTTCDQSGEAYGSAAWADPVEIEGLSAGIEGRLARERKAGKCGGCGGHGAGPAIDVLAIFNAGKDAFKEGLEMGLGIAKPAARIPTKQEIDEIKKAIDAQKEFEIQLHSTYVETKKAEAQ